MIAGELPVIAPKVIKTARVRVEVKRGGFLDALQEATTVAGTYGGFVVSSSAEGEKARRGSLVIRVPADRFEAALAETTTWGPSIGKRWRVRTSDRNSSISRLVCVT